MPSLQQIMIRKTGLVIPIASALLMLVSAGASAQTKQLSADMKGQKNDISGTVTLEAASSGTTLVKIDIQNVPEGVHAIHVHETGQCEGDFESAGGHYAAGMSHGIMHEDGKHPGDLPNVTAGSDGVVKVEFFSPDLKLDDQLMDQDGAAVILHESEDDYQSQPSGDAGGRIACGILQ